MKRLLCLIGSHQWVISPFRALNALPGEHTVFCQRCDKHETRDRDGRRI